MGCDAPDRSSSWQRSDEGPLPSSLIEIVADDLAFESDVRAWCETTESTLITLTRDGIRITAVIRMPKEHAA